MGEAVANISGLGLREREGGGAVSRTKLLKTLLLTAILRGPEIKIMRHY